MGSRVFVFSQFGDLILQVLDCDLSLVLEHPVVDNPRTPRFLTEDARPAMAAGFGPRMNRFQGKSLKNLDLRRICGRHSSCEALRFFLAVAALEIAEYDSDYNGRSGSPKLG